MTNETDPRGEIPSGLMRLYPRPGHDCIMFDYTNHRGQAATRRCMVHYCYYGTTPYHHNAQWLLHGYDLAKHSDRTYAMQDMGNIRNLRTTIRNTPVGVFKDIEDK